MQKFKTANPTVNDYVAFRKDWHERGVDIDALCEEEIQRHKDLRVAVTNLTGLTDTELNLITLCRIYLISKDVGKCARLLIKQQKERDELFGDLYNKV